MKFTAQKRKGVKFNIVKNNAFAPLREGAHVVACAKQLKTAGF
jgi:hypothetical protein